MADHEILYLISTAGHPNYGDELIAETWLRYLAERRPDAEVWLDCPQPGRASVLLADAHPRLRVTDTLWRVSAQADDTDRARAHARARELTTHRGTPREDLGLEIAARAASIHLIGGGHLTSQWPSNLLLPTIVSQLHRDHGIPVSLTGVGLLPIDDADAPLVREALADFTYADVRDSESAAAFDLPLAADDAFLGLATGGARIDRRPAPDVMMLLQGDVHDPEVMEQAVEPALAALRDAGLGSLPLGLVEAIPPDDHRLVEAITERWTGPVRFIPFAEVWKEGLPVRKGQTWVTSRFHLHLMAAAHGAQGIAFNSGNEYYRIKHASLTELGTGWALAGPEDPFPSPSLDPGFPAKAQELGQARRRVADKIYPAAPQRKRGLFGR